MNQTDSIRSIYNGDLREFKKIISNKNDIRIYTVNDLMHAQNGEEYRIGLIPLILKSEAEHPENFIKYKTLIDVVVQKEGVDSVLFAWKNPNFFKYPKNNSSLLENIPVPVSKKMNTYLHHLEVRNMQARKQKISLLQAIDEETKSSDPDVKKAVQIIKRQIVKNYRLSNPKTNER